MVPSVTQISLPPLDSIVAVISKVPKGNWGSRRKTTGLGSIAEAVGLSKDGERFQWIKKYFAAKQCALRSAGYPDEIGGVISPKL